jgi:mRNA interferase MazF
VAAWQPAWGDVVWLDFNPQRGREQAGTRPGLIVSNSFYNRRNGLALICPITSRKKGYPFEVGLPQGFAVQGVVLADQIKAIDWKARAVRFAAKCPPDVVADVVARIRALMVEA